MLHKMGKELCESCEEAFNEDDLDEDGLCSSCAELRDEMDAADAAERAVEEPIKTMDEIHREAWEQHQELHRR